MLKPLFLLCRSNGYVKTQNTCVSLVKMREMGILSTPSFIVVIIKAYFCLQRKW